MENTNFKLSTARWMLSCALGLHAVYWSKDSFPDHQGSMTVLTTYLGKPRRKPQPHITGLPDYHTLMVSHGGWFMIGLGKTRKLQRYPLVI